jgi:ketosteroid isomerase-like protein
MLIGPQEIGDNMLAAFASGFTLSWEPARAEISRGGKLGYTWGRYQAVVSGKTREGTYMTVWEKQPDGTWKVLFDTGDPD